MTPWYVEYFRGDYQRVFRFDPARSAAEAEFASRALGLGVSERVLDLCCGAGRHLRELPGGFGLDLNLQSLRGLRAACGDMRALPFRGASFDAVVSFFSSFGYVDDSLVLREVARVLKPGGQVLLDLLNREHALSGFVEQTQHEGPDGALIVERRSWDALRSVLSVGYVVISGEEQREFAGHQLRLYTLTEIAALLAGAGFELQAVYGDFDGEAYGLDSPRMIVVARRSR